MVRSSRTYSCQLNASAGRSLSSTYLMSFITGFYVSSSICRTAEITEDEWNSAKTQAPKRKELFFSSWITPDYTQLRTPSKGRKNSGLKLPYPSYPFELAPISYHVLRSLSSLTTLTKCLIRRRSKALSIFFSVHVLGVFRLREFDHQINRKGPVYVIQNILLNYIGL